MRAHIAVLSPCCPHGGSFLYEESSGGRAEVIKYLDTSLLKKNKKRYIIFKRQNFKFLFFSFSLFFFLLVNKNSEFLVQYIIEAL